MIVHMSRHHVPVDSNGEDDLSLVSLNAHGHHLPRRFRYQDLGQGVKHASCIFIQRTPVGPKILFSNGGINLADEACKQFDVHSSDGGKIEDSLIMSHIHPHPWYLLCLPFPHANDCTRKIGFYSSWTLKYCLVWYNKLVTTLWSYLMIILKRQICLDWYGCWQTKPQVDHLVARNRTHLYMYHRVLGIYVREVIDHPKIQEIQIHVSHSSNIPSIALLTFSSLPYCELS